MKMQDVLSSKKFVFIVGAPRSGTTWLHELLSNHNEISSIAPIEQTIFGNYLPEIINIWQKQKTAIQENKWVQGLPAIWSQEEFDDFVLYFINNVYLKINDKNKSAKIILDKHPNYSNHLDIIKKYIPNAKFIQIIRDGRDVAISSRKAFHKYGFMHDNIQIISQKWVKYNQSIDNYSQMNKGDVLTIRYEDLVQDTLIKDQMEKILLHCGVESTESIIEECLIKSNKKINTHGEMNADVTKSKRMDAKVWGSDLRLRDKYVFNSIAGDYLRQLGYAKDNSWLCEKFGDRAKLFLIKISFMLRRQF